MENKTIIKAILIDDEPGCVSHLRHSLLTNCPDIHIVGTGHSGDDFIWLTKHTAFDVAFLDIKMFDDNVFTILKLLPPVNFEIVFVTAYDTYAVRAIKIDALDYILKPLLKEEIVSCYEKIKKRFSEKNLVKEAAPHHAPGEPSKIEVQLGERIVMVGHPDIIYLKAKGPYTEIFFSYAKKIVKATISKHIGVFEHEFCKDAFFRIHKSYLINSGRIREIIKNDVHAVKMDNDDILPVAQRRVHDFLLYCKGAQ